VPSTRHSLVVPCVLVCVSFVLGCNVSNVPVELSITPQSKLLFAGDTISFTSTDSLGADDILWTASEIGGLKQPIILPLSAGSFTAPEVTLNTNYLITIRSRRNSSKFASANLTVLPNGSVTPTVNPQVADYVLQLPPGASAYIEFGTDKNYQLKTWTQAAPTNGGGMSFLVAGMLASTQYHMRAVVIASDGTQSFDVDHTFTTQSIPAVEIPSLSVSTTPGQSPQPGIEVLNLIGTPSRSLVAFDLSGNLIWSSPISAIDGVHLLPNGHFLICTAAVVEEVDLIGNIIQQEQGNSLNASLTAAGSNLQIEYFHHDVIALPNGHWIALAATARPCVGRDVCAANPTITGDVLIDLAPQPGRTFSPVWVWNSFDHLDVTRTPMSVADWTHSNAILYSPDDGNLMLSMRHQNWILKIDYNHGQGAGDILWHLGYQGEFTLLGGTDPTDWFYAQHRPSFATVNSAGRFSLVVMDNGDDRVFPAGVTCGAQGQPLCFYSASLLLEIDENAKTASIAWKYSPGEYSPWGGDGQLLANGDFEADFTAGSAETFSDIFEVTPGTAPEVVWHLRTNAENAYRGFRLPSLYPGVQW
jgi:arylsulfate sulfotransferase